MRSVSWSNRNCSKGMAARIDFDPLHADLDRIIEGWLPLTFAVNSINRSMGVPDLYPFVVSPPVIGKLAFVHDCIREQAGRKRRRRRMRAMIAGLRQRAGFPRWLQTSRTRMSSIRRLDAGFLGELHGGLQVFPEKLGELRTAHQVRLDSKHSHFRLHVRVLQRLFGRVMQLGDDVGGRLRRRR